MIRGLQRWFLLEALRRESEERSCCLQLLEATYIPWFVTPSSIFAVHHSNLGFLPHIIADSDSSSVLFIRMLCLYWTRHVNPE